MSRDAGARSVAELREFGQQVQQMGEQMYEVMVDARNRMDYVSEGWDDEENEKFKVVFDDSVNLIRQMSETFSSYNRYIQEICARLDDYKSVRIR